MNNAIDREELLAFVAEKYYQEDLKQSEIANMIGLTRSAVSRMLTEARNKGLVEIIIHHPFQNDRDLEVKIGEAFGLIHVAVVSINNQLGNDKVKDQLGKAAARLLSSLIKPGGKVGVSWGTSVQATIEVYETAHVPDTQVIQLVGVLGSTRHSYSAQTLVERLAQKIGGEGTYLYSPFIVENSKTAESLLEDPAVKQAVAIGKECDIALMGVGTTKREFCSLYKGNHISHKTVAELQAAGAVGDVCALYFDKYGNPSPVEFHRRRIGIQLSDLKKIPIRLAVAGNIEKTEAILGAIRGGYINSLITDNQTASHLLQITKDYK